MSEAGERARGFTVETARAEDVDAVVALERAVEFAPRWGREVYKEMMQAGDVAGGVRRHLVVAKDRDGCVTGFAAGSMHRALADSAVLESVAVAAAARRAGVGRTLCEAVIGWCRAQGATEVGLEVRRGSAGAIALYKALGFMEVGIRPGYYGEPVGDAVMMRMDFGVG